MRFEAGMDGKVGGVEWRADQGDKTPGDLVLCIRTVGWVKAKMAVGFLFADFYAQNEETLAREGYWANGVAGRAGELYVESIKGSQLWGWDAATAKLERQRENRRRNGG